MNSKKILFDYNEVKTVDSKSRIIIPKQYDLKGIELLISERIRIYSNEDLCFLKCIPNTSSFVKDFLSKEKNYAVSYKRRIDNQRRLLLGAETSRNFLKLRLPGEFYFVGKGDFFEIYNVEAGEKELRRCRLEE